MPIHNVSLCAHNSLPTVHLIFLFYFACTLPFIYILRSAIFYVTKFERTNGIIYARYQPLRDEINNDNMKSRILSFSYFFFTVAPLSPLKMADYRLASLEGLNHICSKKIDWPTATIHITENPISEAVVC